MTSSSSSLLSGTASGRGFGGAVSSRGFGGAVARQAALLAGSGFCSLVYQTMWLRELRTVFGASTPATAAALAVFMGGLGLGGVLFGGRAERTQRPLRMYALLELGVALCAALSPLLLDGARALYYAAGGSSSLSGPGALFVRLLLTALALGAPVVLMGGTFPAMARAIALVSAGVDAAHETRRPLAVLYGVNTLGAVAGAVASTFALLEIFGVRTSIWLACLVNALVAAIALTISRRLEVAPSASASASKVASVSASDASTSTLTATSTRAPRRRRPAVLLAAFATGLTFLLLELVWYRLTAPLLGGSTYSFGLVLAVALFGVGAGGLAYAFWGPLRPTPGRFAVTCALQATLLLVPFALGDDVARLAFHLREMGEPTFFGLVVSWTLVTSLLVLPAALVAGWQFPLLLALAGDGADGAAQDSGDVYAANTLGSIVGSIAGGFGALPLLSAPGAWKLAAVVLIVAGLFFVRGTFQAGSRDRARGLAFIALSACAFWLASATGPTALWRHTAIGAGRANVAAATWNERESQKRSLGRSVYEEHDGVESALAFTLGHGESLIVNGKSDGNTLGDPQTQIGLGLVPALLHGATTGGARNAFVIGLGTGQTAGWLAQVPGMERVDVAEIEPRVIDFARYNKDTNANAVDAKNVNVIVADGREALATASERYDLIVSEPSNPYRAGIASFYSVDFYRSARERLAKGGVFAQWLQAYEIEATAMQTAVATMLEVFPHAIAMRLEPGDLLIMAREDDTPIDVERLRALLEIEPFKTVTTRVMFSTGAEGFLARVYANDVFLHRLAAGALEHNSDDLPLLEVSFARSVGKTAPALIAEMLQIARARGEERPPLTGTVDDALVEAQRGRLFVADGTTGYGMDTVEAAWVQQDASAAVAAMAADGERKNAGDVVGRMIRASVKAQQGLAIDDVELAALVDAGFATEVAFIRLERAIANKDAPSLLPLLDDALDLLARDPWLHMAFTLGAMRRLQSFDYSNARELPALLAERLVEERFAGRHSETERYNVAEQLLRKRGGGPMPASCMKIFAPMEPNPVWALPWLDQRLSCYRAFAPERAANAEADLEALLEHSAVPLASVMPP